MLTFGLKYYAELRSKYKGVFWRTEIAERGYYGSAEQMTFDGSDPLKITWEKRGDEFYAPVKASEATINVLCNENFHYIDLFTSDPRKFRVSIYRNTVLYWLSSKSGCGSAKFASDSALALHRLRRGFVTADLYSENYTDKYIDFVAENAYISPDVSLDTTDHDAMLLIVSAMSRTENGVPAVIKDVEQGWQLFVRQLP